jgi:hypothetical protein
MLPNHFFIEITIIAIVTIILYIPKEHEHVVWERNINNATEDNKNTHKAQ